MCFLQTCILEYIVLKIIFIRCTCWIKNNLKLNIVFVISEEDGFLRSVILDVNSSGTQFKLAPTYTSYMAVRYCISGGYRPDMSPHDRAHRVTGLVKKISHLVHQAVQVCGIILV